MQNLFSPLDGEDGLVLFCLDMYVRSGGRGSLPGGGGVEGGRARRSEPGVHSGAVRSGPFCVRHCILWAGASRRPNLPAKNRPRDVFLWRAKGHEEKITNQMPHFIYLSTRSKAKVYG